MEEISKPYQKWEKYPSFETTDGRRVYPLFAPAQGLQPNHIRVFDRDVDSRDYDVEHSLLVHLVAYLDWRGRTISYVETGRIENGEAIPGVDECSWRCQGIAREMLRLARKLEPELRHAPCSDRSDAGEKFVLGTDPEQACSNDCGDGCRMRGTKESSERMRPAMSAQQRAKRLFGFLWGTGKSRR